jgi:hypothetical protein
MDHNEAIQLQTAEKYVLGELSEAARNEFEEHFFDCAECAQDMRAAAVFVDTTREVLSKQLKNAPVEERMGARAGWFAWLRPVVAVPAFAVLLIALAYQSLVTVPQWKNAAAQATSPRVLTTLSLIAGNSRGPESSTLRVRAGEPFGLFVDVPTDPKFRAYDLRLEGPDGSAQMLRTVPYAEAQKTVVIEVTPGKHAGTYQLVVLGRADEAAAVGTTIAAMKFQIELIN